MTFTVFLLRDFIKTLGSSKKGKKIEILIYFKGETFVRSKLLEVKNSQSFRDNLSRMTSNDVFCENLTYANDFLSGKN